MANGIPCIASDIDAMPDILAMERGFVVPLQDFMMLAQRVRQLLTDDDLYAKMSKMVWWLCRNITIGLK